MRRGNFVPPNLSGLLRVLINLVISVDVCYVLDLNCFPKGVCSEGGFWKWLDPKGSNFFSGLIFWWIHSLMELLETSQGEWVMGAWPWGLCLVPGPFLSHFLSLSLLPSCNWVSSFTRPCPSAVVFQLPLGPHQWNLLTADENLWNYEVKWIFPPLGCFAQVFVDRNERLINIVVWQQQDDTPVIHI